MSGPDLLYVVAFLALMALNAFFVAAEYALVSVRRTRMIQLREEGSKAAGQVVHALDDVNMYVSTVQVGVTMCSLGLGWLGAPAVAQLLNPMFEAIGISGSAVDGASFVVSFLLITYLTVAFAEVTPKYFALQRAERVAVMTIRPMILMRRVFSPLIWILNKSADIALRVIGVDHAPGMHVIHSEEELKMLVSQSSKGGVLEDSEQEMLYNVFDFADTDVSEVMVPRPDVVAFAIDMPPHELLDAIVAQPFTRYPVYRDSMDDVAGILHSRDLFTAAQRDGAEKVDIPALLRSAHVVPESKSLAGLLNDFRRSKSHMALVVDEYGSLAGIVTLEDLLEEIVGEIDDEHDRPEEPVERIADGHIRVHGKFPVDELNERFDLDLPTEDYHTIGGVVFGLLGQQPHTGDVVRHGDVSMEVTETDGARIVHVDIIRSATQPNEIVESANGTMPHSEQAAEADVG
jgi:CBS domain containing-hemolysin-like protein